MARGESGVALLVAMMVMTIVSVLGLGLLLTTSLEPVTAANYESSIAALYAAEAGVAVAAHELGGMTDWDPVLAGRTKSAVLDPPAGSIPAPDGAMVAVGALTNLANCGHESACSEAEMTALTPERPWGPNNPRWQPFGRLRLDRMAPGPPGSAAPEVVVWVGDDPAEIDGDPFTDSRPDAAGMRPGSCIVFIRAEALSPRSGHRTVTATVGRADGRCGTGARLFSWAAGPP
jgi:hypothetical protein